VVAIEIKTHLYGFLILYSTSKEIRFQFFGRGFLSSQVKKSFSRNYLRLGTVYWRECTI